MSNCHSIADPGCLEAFYGDVTHAHNDENTNSFGWSSYVFWPIWPRVVRSSDGVERPVFSRSDLNRARTLQARISRAIDEFPLAKPIVPFVLMTASGAWVLRRLFTCTQDELSSLDLKVRSYIDILENLQRAIDASD